MCATTSAKALAPRDRAKLGDALGLWWSSSWLALAPVVGPCCRHRYEMPATRGLYKRRDYEQIVKVVSSHISRQARGMMKNARNPLVPKGLTSATPATRKRLARICGPGV